MTTQHTPEDLLDADGENRAVRMFLAIYGTSSLTIQAMKRHLECCGYPYWPEWADKYQASDTQHLTKLGAQNWLRHLFALEPDAIRARACVNACAGIDMTPDEYPVLSETINRHRKLAAKNQELRAAAADVLVHRMGELPTRGWLVDNDASRAALDRLAQAIAKSGESAEAKPTVVCVACGINDIDFGITEEERLSRAQENIDMIANRIGQTHNVDLLESCKSFRDSVLHQRWNLEDNGMTSDQINDVLNLFDTLIGDEIAKAGGAS